MTMPYYPDPEPGRSTPPPGRNRALTVKAALIGVGIAAGALGATAIGASAASGGSTAPTSSTSSTPSTSDNDGDHAGGRGGGHDGEKALPAATTATLRAAALKAVPGGTVERIESDSGDATYEAHMTKSDGTEVTVKFDKNLKVTGIEAGKGK